MAVTGALVEIDGEAAWTVSKLSVVEDATPLDPSDMTGGIGQINYTIPNTPENKRNVRNKPVHVEHAQRGIVEGKNATFGGSRSVINITANTRLIDTNVEKTLQPYSGTLGGLITTWLAVCGITTGINVESNVASKSVVVPGGRFNVWERLKEVTSALGVDIAEVDGIIVVRRPRTRLADTHRDSSLDWMVDDGAVAQTIEIKYYNSVQRTNALAYPAGGWNSDVDVYSVDANEVVEVDLELNASLSSVKQPVCVSSVAKGYDDSSVYCVAGNDGLIVPPAQWKDGGGSIKVKIDETTRTLKLTITGMAGKELAPYRIMMPSGETDGYSSLRIVGTGVFFREQTLVMSACSDPALAPEEVGVTIENEAVRTKDQAWHVGLAAATRYSGAFRRIQVSTKGTRRDGADYGNTSGSRVEFDGGMYRLRANTSETDYRYTADQDTIIRDRNARWRGRTYADWNEYHAGKTYGDLKLAPLDAPPLPVSDVYPDIWYPDMVYPA